MGAIRKLPWPNIDLNGKTVRWRGENEKTGYEHRTPVTSKARTNFRGSAKVQPWDRGRTPSGRTERKAETLAELEPKRLRTWRSPEAEIGIRTDGAKGGLRARRVEDCKLLLPSRN